MGRLELLDESRIVLGIGGGLSSEDVLSILVEAALGDKAPSDERLLRALVAREQRMTTGIGRGVAIPHVRCSHISEPAAALGVCPEGIDFSAVDEEPVHIVFTFVTPESERGLHIETLASVVETFAASEMREAVVAAQTPADVLRLLDAAHR